MRPLLPALVGLVALAGCPASDEIDDDPGPVDTDTGQDTGAEAEPSAVSLQLPRSVLRAGERFEVQVEVTDADGHALDLTPTLEVADATVLEVDGLELVGLAPGETTVTARLDALVSESVSLRVVEAPPEVDPELDFSASSLLVGVGETVHLPLVVRDDRGLPVEPGHMTYEVGDESLIDVSGEEPVTVAAGRTWIRATWRETASPRLPVTITEDGRAFGLRRVVPDGVVVADQGVRLHWETAYLPVVGDLTEPTLAERVEVVDDASGDVLGEASLDFGEAWFDLDTSGWEPGTYTLRGRAVLGEETADEAAFQVVVEHPDRTLLQDLLLGSFVDESAWTNNRLDASRHLLVGAPDGTPWVSSFIGSSLRAGAWRDESWKNPAGEGYSRSTSAHATIRWFANTWHPNASVRGPAALAVDGQGRPVIAYTLDDTAHGRDPNYYQSILAARWQSDGHHGSGNGGWVILGPERRHEIHDLSDVPRNAYPAGPLPDRTHTAWSQQLTFVPGTETPILGMMAQPRASDVWTLHVRRFEGSDWTDHAASVDLSLTLATLVQLHHDVEGHLFATVHGLVDGVPSTARVSLDDGGVVVVPGLARFSAWHDLAVVERDGDLRLARLQGGALQEEAVLDRHPFATATSACLAETDRALFVAWHEGPEGARRVRSAFWSSDTQRFVPVDLAPDLAADAASSAPSCGVTPEGHGLLGWTEPGFYGRLDVEDDRLFVARISPLSD